MEICLCSNCNKLFFFDSKLTPYRTYGGGLCQKIIVCPRCGEEYSIAEYDDEELD